MDDSYTSTSIQSDKTFSLSSFIELRKELQKIKELSQKRWNEIGLPEDFIPPIQIHSLRNVYEQLVAPENAGSLLLVDSHFLGYPIIVSETVGELVARASRAQMLGFNVILFKDDKIYFLPKHSSDGLFRL
jgi:hypothetical protein